MDVETIHSGLLNGNYVSSIPDSKTQAMDRMDLISTNNRLKIKWLNSKGMEKVHRSKETGRGKNIPETPLVCNPGGRVRGGH